MAKNLLLRSLISIFLLGSACSTTVAPKVTPQVAEVAQPVAIPQLEVEKLIITPNPDGHRDFINAILAAKKSVHLAVFHLTNDEVVQALIQAKKNGVEVKVILDGKSMILGRFKDPYKKLIANNIEVVESSKKFSITHEKSMVIDHELAFITAINLTMNFATTRDFGVITKNSDIISEMELVFQTDLENARQSKGVTPPLKSSFLIWSPVNSQEKIIQLIGTASKTIDLEVENFGDQQIQQALSEAAKKNVHVRVIVPLCDKNFNPFHNVRYINEMALEKIDARVMPSPSTVDSPYMHSKMILVDGQSIYLGSVNFSNNSTKKARELGVIFSNEKVAKQISTEYEKDWQAAISLPEKRSRIQCIRDMRGVL